MCRETGRFVARGSAPGRGTRLAVGKEYMRVLFIVALAALSLSLVACSGGSEDTTLRRAPVNAPARSQAPSGAGGGDDATTSTTPAPPPQGTPSDSSAPAPDGGAGTPSAPPSPPAPGSCGAPKCFGLGGFGGCKATDGAGITVPMACQDGACACLKGAQTTSTFEGDVTSADDARQLFLGNCDCD